jgi:hypothetical protein
MKINEDIEYDFEAIKLHFIADWEDGKAPTLQDYVERHPRFKNELIEFVMSFAPLKNGMKGMIESPVASDSTLRIIEEKVARTSTPVKNLTEARQTMGWSVARLARELNVPERMGMYLVRGAIREWPPALERRLAGVLCRTQAQVVELLRNSAPIPATQFKAKGQPQIATARMMTFSEALADCEKRGELTPEQRREWLETA